MLEEGTQSSCAKPCISTQWVTLTSDPFLLLQLSCKLFDLDTEFKEKPWCLQERPHALLRRDIVSFHSHKAIWLANWMCVAPNDGMQGDFPNRGTHFNVTTYNHSCCSAFADLFPWLIFTSNGDGFHFSSEEEFEVFSLWWAKRWELNQIQMVQLSQV